MIEKIVLSQKKEIENFLIKKNLIRREKEKEFRKWINKDIIKVITGIRRSGKTTFGLTFLKNKKFAYLNFDDEELLKYNFNDILKGVYSVYGNFSYLFLDEIQNLKNWELIVNKLKRKGLNLIVTGSNSKLLSKELTTHLTGRYIEIEIFPFSFKEFLEAKKVNKKNIVLEEEVGLIKKYLNEYIEKGGFPEIVVKEYDLDYLKFLYNSILFNDVVKRYNLKYSSLLKELAYFLISNFSSEISYNKIYKTLNFGSVHTVENYISHLEEAYLIFLVNRFSFSIREQIKSSKKIYSIDTGLINSVSFKFSKNLGRLMENVVFIELKRNNKEIYYYKTKNNKEIDFLVKNRNKIELIEVAYEFDEEHKKKLIKAMKELNLKESLCITWDEEDVIEEKGKKIKLVPLWKWLLS